MIFHCRNARLRRWGASACSASFAQVVNVEHGASGLTFVLLELRHQAFHRATGIRQRGFSDLANFLKYRIPIRHTNLPGIQQACKSASRRIQASPKSRRPSAEYVRWQYAGSSASIDILHRRTPPRLREVRPGRLLAASTNRTPRRRRRRYVVSGRAD